MERAVYIGFIVFVFHTGIPFPNYFSDRTYFLLFIFFLSVFLSLVSYLWQLSFLWSIKGFGGVFEGSFFVCLFLVSVAVSIGYRHLILFLMFVVGGWISCHCI